MSFRLRKVLTKMVLFIIVGHLKTCTAGTVIVTSASEQFIITDQTGDYSLGPSRCSAEGGTLKDIASNNEFVRISNAFNDLNDRNRDVFLRLAELNTMSGSYRWTSEAISSSQWIASGEPNQIGRYDFDDTQICNAGCVVMSRTYPAFSGFSSRHFLKDTCCLNLNHFLCEDLNECDSNNGGCPAGHTCVNTIGSRTCLEPDVSLSATLTNVPLGGSVTLTCTSKDGPQPDNLYTLYHNGNVDLYSTVTVFSIANFNPSVVGQYQCTVTDSGGTESDRSVAVQVNLAPPSKPTVAAPILNIALGLGDDTTLTCSPSNSESGTFAYTWGRNGETLFGETESVLQVTDFGPDDVGDYVCALTITGTTLTSDVSDPLRIELRLDAPTLQVDNPRPLIGGTVILRCQTSTAGVTEYVWEKDGVQYDTTSAGTVVRTLTNFQNEMAGMYSCFYRVGVESSATSSSAQVQAGLSTPSLRVTSTDVVPGSSTTLTCDGEFIPGWEGVWKKDGVLQVRNSLVWIISNFEADDEGEYTCQLKVNSEISEISNAIILRANLSVPVLTTTNTLVEEGAEVQLSCQNEMLFISLPSYRWVHNTVGLPEQGATLTLSSFQESMEGEYRCGVIINGVTSELSEPVEIMFRGAPLLSIPITEIPAGTKIQLTCEHQFPSDSAIRWLKNGRVLSERTLGTLSFLNFRQRNEGEYRCEVSEDGQGWETSNTKSLALIPRESLCRCPCGNENVSSNNNLLSAAAIEEVATTIKKDLMVEVKTLSASVRKLSSASDERTSSTSVGWSAVALLSIVFGLILMSDFYYIIQFIQDLFNRFRK